MVLGFLLGVVLLLGLAVVRSLVVDEAKGRLWDVSSALVEGAVMRLPVAYQDEKRAEWHAELDEQRGKPLGALHWSWNLYRSRRSMAHELRADTELSPIWSPEQAVPDRLDTEPLHPRLQAAVDLAKRFGWQDILIAMDDPALAEVENPLVAATDRFCRTIEESRVASGQILDRYEPALNRSFGIGAYRQPPEVRRWSPRPLALRPAPLIGLRSGRWLTRPRKLILDFFALFVGVLCVVSVFFDHPFALAAILLGSGVVGARTVFGPRRLSIIAPAVFLFGSYVAGIPMLLGLMPEGCFAVSVLLVPCAFLIIL